MRDRQPTKHPLHSWAMAYGKLLGKGHSEWNCRPAILSILLVLFSLDLVFSQTVFIHWDEVSRGNYEPRLEGFGEPPQWNKEAAAASHAPSQQEVPSSSPVEYVTSDVDEDVSPSLQEKHFIDTCGASRLREVVKQLNIRCLACSDKSHFKDAITEFVSSLSIRSLKNMLAERGRMCIRCKTRADLLSSVLQVVHLPAANVTFPVIVSFVTVLFPRGIAEFVTQDVKVIRLLRDLQSSNKKFAVSSGTKVATVAKVLSIQDVSEGTVKAKLRGGQRIRINQTWTDVKSDFTYINGTLFSDEAIKSTRTDEMKELHKQTRRIFFSLDHDAAADARSSSIGNPPAEAEGPEAFLNWLCMALAYNVFWRSQTNPFTMVTRQALLQSTDTVAKMKTVRDILIRHSEGALSSSSPFPSTVFFLLLSSPLRVSSLVVSTPLLILLQGCTPTARLHLTRRPARSNVRRGKRALLLPTRSRSRTDIRCRDVWWSC